MTSYRKKWIGRDEKQSQSIWWTSWIRQAKYANRVQCFPIMNSLSLEKRNFNCTQWIVTLKLYLLQLENTQRDAKNKNEQYWLIPPIILFVFWLMIA